MKKLIILICIISIILTGCSKDIIEKNKDKVIDTAMVCDSIYDIN